jgi:hypothetical protein
VRFLDRGPSHSTTGKSVLDGGLKHRTSPLPLLPTKTKWLWCVVRTVYGISSCVVWRPGKCRRPFEKVRLGHPVRPFLKRKLVLIVLSARGISHFSRTVPRLQTVDAHRQHGVSLFIYLLLRGRLGAGSAPRAELLPQPPLSAGGGPRDWDWRTTEPHARAWRCYATHRVLLRSWPVARR